MKKKIIILILALSIFTTNATSVYSADWALGAGVVLSKIPIPTVCAVGFAILGVVVSVDYVRTHEKEISSAFKEATESIRKLLNDTTENMETFISEVERGVIDTSSKYYKAFGDTLSNLGLEKYSCFGLKKFDKPFVIKSLSMYSPYGRNISGTSKHMSQYLRVDFLLDSNMFIFSYDYIFSRLNNYKIKYTLYESPSLMNKWEKVKEYSSEYLSFVANEFGFIFYQYLRYNDYISSFPYFMKVDYNVPFELPHETQKLIDMYSGGVIDLNDVYGKGKDLTDVIEGVAGGTISREQLIDLVGVKSKEKAVQNAISKEKERAKSKEVSKSKEAEKEIDKEVEKKVEVDKNSGLPKSMFLKGLEKVFPFSIPFDIYGILKQFLATPVTPSYKFKIELLGKTYVLKMDLKKFNGIAKIVRNLEFVAFAIVLAVKTRSMIKV